MKIRSVTAFMAVFLVGATALPGGKKEKSPSEKTTGQGPAVLWRNPTDIRSRDLFWGPGGQEHQPHGRFTFIEEDLDGSNPKFVLKDENGVKWKAKLGLEAQPETVATRLVWAAGYFANEDYFVRDLQIDNIPAHLHRGRKLVGSGGMVHNVRLKRYLKDEKKLGEWAWFDSPFTGMRELNGLRVVMALINNWDLKDENNTVYSEKAATDPQGPERIYMVSDLGATFGTPGLTWPLKKTRGNLGTYRHSKFIAHETTQYVDLRTPARASLYFLATPKEYSLRLHLREVGKHIPRADARWIGDVLAQLSAGQIRDAFRAAGYSPEEATGFTAVIQERIGELEEL